MPTDDATTTEGVLRRALTAAFAEAAVSSGADNCMVWESCPERDTGGGLGMCFCALEAQTALAALLVPTVEADCPTCGGPRSRYMADCSRCNQGKVQVRALDVWLADQGDQ